MRLIAYFLICLVIGISAVELKSQHLPEHVSNEGLYDFLDELANEGLINLPSAARPYSRKLIVDLLGAVASANTQLTSRQRFMLSLYSDYFLERTGSGLRQTGNMLSGEVSFFPPAYNYLERGANIRLRPLLESHYHENSHGNLAHFHYGIELTSYVGEAWSAWAGLQQVSQTNEVLTHPGFLNRHEGGTWSQEKEIPEDESYVQNTDIRGGVAYSWEWGTLAFQKEHLSWGDHYHTPNILDKRHNTPSYPMVAFEVNTGNRLSFHYHHGWLNSMEIQDTIVFENHPDRYEYHNKFFAGNLLTLMLLDGLHFSAGNAIVYSGRNMYIGNFIPIMLFRSLEPSQAEQDHGHINNTMVFLNVSSRQIRHLHLYGSWFSNSFKLERVFDSGLTNYNSTKVGARLSNWPVINTDLTVEYTFTMPKTFEHRTPIITYAHENFNMGHYLGANANELYASLGVKPWRGLSLRLCYNHAQKGNLYPHTYGYAQDIDPYMEKVVWQNRSYSLEANYTLWNNIGLFARVRHMHTEGFDVDDHNDYSAQDYLDMFSPAFHHGETTTFSFGFYMR